MSLFVKTVGEYNKCTFFILPLIQLSKFSFGAGNFVDSYVDWEGTRIIVKVRDLRLSLDFSSHWAFQHEEQFEDYGLLYFSIDPIWRDDFHLFRQGKYSRMSEAAKAEIYQFSGLSYKERKPEGVEVTDARLLALERSPLLRVKWEKELGLYERGNDPISEESELLDPPSESCFIQL